MKLSFFGRLRDSVGAPSLDYSAPATVHDSEALRQSIGARFPDLLEPTVRIAVDDVLTAGPVPIAGAREIAFLPPVSGG